jgi:sugar phosphate isomerase/epimerase
VTSFSPGLCSVTFRQFEARHVLRLAQEAGLSAIEWGSDIHVPPTQIAIARQICSATLTAGLKPASYGSYVAPPDSGMEAFERALKAAAALGATNIRIWPGRRGQSSIEYTEYERAYTAAQIRDMAVSADHIGITVSLEYHLHSLTDEADSAVRLIDQIGHSNVYLYWQPRPGLPLKEALTEISRVGPHLSHIHVFAWDEQRRRYPLAAQEAYWRDIFQAVPKTRFPRTRYALLEFVAGDDVRSFKEDAGTLRRLLAR